jgi:carboxyl-terminal processing protease
MKNDATLKEKRVRWHENLAKDVYVEEAINVLDDLQNNSTDKTTINTVKKTKTIKS